MTEDKGKFNQGSTGKHPGTVGSPGADVDEGLTRYRRPRLSSAGRRASVLEEMERRRRENFAESKRKFYGSLSSLSFDSSSDSSLSPSEGVTPIILPVIIKPPTHLPTIRSVSPLPEGTSEDLSYSEYEKDDDDVFPQNSIGSLSRSSSKFTVASRFSSASSAENSATIGKGSTILLRNFSLSGSGKSATLPRQQTRFASQSSYDVVREVARQDSFSIKSSETDRNQSVITKTTIRPKNNINSNTDSTVTNNNTSNNEINFVCKNNNSKFLEGACSDKRVIVDVSNEQEIENEYTGTEINDKKAKLPVKSSGGDTNAEKVENTAAAQESAEVEKVLKDVKQVTLKEEMGEVEKVKLECRTQTSNHAEQNDNAAAVSCTGVQKNSEIMVENKMYIVTKKEVREAEESIVVENNPTNDMKIDNETAAELKTSTGTKTETQIETEAVIANKQHAEYQRDILRVDVQGDCKINTTESNSLDSSKAIDSHLEEDMGTNAQQSGVHTSALTASEVEISLEPGIDINNATEIVAETETNAQDVEVVLKPSEPEIASNLQSMLIETSTENILQDTFSAGYMPSSDVIAELFKSTVASPAGGIMSALSSSVAAAVAVVVPTPLLGESMNNDGKSVFSVKSTEEDIMVTKQSVPEAEKSPGAENNSPADDHSLSSSSQINPEDVVSTDVVPVKQTNDITIDQATEKTNYRLNGTTDTFTPNGTKKESVEELLETTRHVSTLNITLSNLPATQAYSAENYKNVTVSSDVIMSQNNDLIEASSQSNGFTATSSQNNDVTVTSNGSKRDVNTIERRIIVKSFDRGANGNTNECIIDSENNYDDNNVTERNFDGTENVSNGFHMQELSHACQMDTVWDLKCNTASSALTMD